MILEFTSQEKAEACLAQIEKYGRLLFAAAGYKVIDGEIMPKSGGQDKPNAQRTTKWDDVHVSPDNTYYFVSPRRKYSEYFDQIVNGFESDFTEKAKPASWDVYQELP